MIETETKWVETEENLVGKKAKGVGKKDKSEEMEGIGVRKRKSLHLTTC